jgi:hypothetical protein
MMEFISMVLLSQPFRIGIVFVALVLYGVAVYRLLVHGAIFIPSPEEEARVLAEVRRIVEADSNNTAYRPND